MYKSRDNFLNAMKKPLIKRVQHLYQESYRRTSLDNKHPQKTRDIDLETDKLFKQAVRELYQLMDCKDPLSALHTDAFSDVSSIRIDECDLLSLKRPHALIDERLANTFTDRYRTSPYHNDSFDQRHIDGSGKYLLQMKDKLNNPCP